MEWLHVRLGRHRAARDRREPNEVRQREPLTVLRGVQSRFGCALECAFQRGAGQWLALQWMGSRRYDARDLSISVGYGATAFHVVKRGSNAKHLWAWR